MVSFKSRKHRSNHRAVSVIIGTLLIVAISVVGGTIVFVFTQGFFSQSQISGTPVIESVKILGYDARDVANLNAHDGVTMTVSSSDPSTPDKNIGERVVVYIQNDSVGQVLLSEIRLGGTVYTYQTVDPIPIFAPGIGGTYGIMTNSTHMITSPVALVQPGETVGIIMDLNDNIPVGRDTQFKLTTTPGAVFVGTVIMGQSAG